MHIIKLETRNVEGEKKKKTSMLCDVQSAHAELNRGIIRSGYSVLNGY